MKKNLEKIFAAITVFMLLFAVALPVYASGEPPVTTVNAAGESELPVMNPIGSEVMEESRDDNTVGDKAIAAGIGVGIAAGAGAIGMGIAVSKSVEAVSRQPEAEGKIRTILMLGLVFVETAIIYALVIAILIIFVL